MEYYLGVQGAARTSHAALATEEGHILCVISAPPLTIRVNPDTKLHLTQTVGRLAKKAGLQVAAMLSGLKGACVAMSGVYLEGDRIALVQLLQQIGISGLFPVVACEDVSAHLAANFLPVGGVVIASTGSNAVLRGTGMVNPIRVDGWGSDIGDDGGGYDLGKKCLRLILRGLDGRSPRSRQMEDRILEHVGLSRPSDLVPWYYGVRGTLRWRSDLADLSIPLVQAAEEDKDHLAQRILRKGARSLLTSLLVAARKAAKERARFEPEPVQVILEGGLFEHSCIYRSTFESALTQMALPELNLLPAWPQYRPVVGALALAASGTPFLDRTSEYHQSLKASADSAGLGLGSARGNTG